MKHVLIPVLCTLLITACSKNSYNPERNLQLKQTDALLAKADTNAIDGNIERLFDVDHSRLAEESGEVLNASRVTVYSDRAINTALLKINPRVGLDLPFKILAFVSAGSEKAEVLTVNAAFLAERHTIKDEASLKLYATRLAELTEGIETAYVPTANLAADYGIVELQSRLAFEASIDALKTAIMAEGDTVWFDRIDYHTEALEIGEKLPYASLLVFGAPAPGAKAMFNFPSIGVDAFPQKVLVYQEADGGVRVIYNDIPAMAELHTGSSALPHKVIKRRLHSTLSSAVQP